MPVSRIPIINYHKICPTLDIGITTRHPDQFHQDLKSLKDLNFHPVTFTEIYRKSNIPENPIIITFDDAYELLLNYAIPAMEEFGFKGVIYVPTNYIGKFNDWDVQFGKLKFKHLNNNQLVEIHKLGYEIGSHAKSHRLLTQMNTKDLKSELFESKSTLEDIIQNSIYSISYPFGKFNQKTIQTSKDAGYKYGVAAIDFNSIRKDDNNFALKRFNIYRFDTNRQLRSKLGLLPNNLISFRDWLIQKGGLATVVFQTFKSKCGEK